jgi:flavorubredoxin
MDHSGSLPKLLALAPDATVVTSPNGLKGLRRHFKADWNFSVVESGDTLNIGQRTLQFFLTPMVHWPDSMMTYLPKEKLLLPNDAFGQHIATPERFDDEVGWDVLYEEAAKYYANIVLPYGEQVKKALATLSGLDLEMVAPSHGILWRSYFPRILDAYQKWAANETEKRALIVYDTMWGSTEKMASSLREGLEKAGVPVTLRNLKTNHISDVMTDVLRSKAILVGSPTLNMGVLPTVGAFLTYLEGLRPKTRIGVAFGSYGWGGQSVTKIETIMKNMGWAIPFEAVKIQYVPDAEELEKVQGLGMNLGEIITKK